jgi:putative hydrolase of the HAD superfamily
VSARAPLDAVVLDAGGTLVRLDFEWIAAMLGELGVAAMADALRHGELRGRLAYDAAVGSSGGALPATATYFGPMLLAAGCPDALLGEALRRMDERQRSDAFLWAKPMEGAREAMDALLGMGLRLACVSNSDGRADAHLLRYGLRRGLEFVVDSAIVGIEKPDSRIFRLALEKLGVTPERALYVGDLVSVDAAGSRAAGMHVVLLDPWGTYAKSSPAIAGIDQLPAFVEQHFLTPSLRTLQGQ